MDKKAAISKRLKEFIDSNFSSVAEFSRQMGFKNRQDAYPYLDGKSLLGAEKLTRLNELGCDINWLLTGGKQPVDVAQIKGKELQYVTIEEAETIKKTPFIEYPLLGNVPAGRHEVYDRSAWPEYERIDYDPRTHFWLKIDDEYGYSMTPFLQPGDKVLCSIKAKLHPGDLVAVRWDKTKGAIKILGQSNIKDSVALASYNAAEMPIVLMGKDLEQIYKIVLIKKKK